MKNSDTLKPLTAYEFCRRIYVSGLIIQSDAIKVQADITTIAGIRTVVADIDKHQIVVCYDVTKTNYQTVVAALKSSGFPIQNSWWSRLKMSWYKFTESNARENTKAPPSACCNKPPK